MAQSAPKKLDGKIQELEEFVLNQGRALLHYIYSMVHQWELAEDLYQETLLSAFKACGRFESKSSMKNWLYKIALNKCRDEWKKENVRRKYTDEIEKEWKEKEAGNVIPEEIILYKQERKELLDKINHLPTKYRDPVLLYYFYDFTIADISNKTKLPLSTIKTHLRRGKQRLRVKEIK